MASDIVQKYRDLVKRLYTKTNDGSLTWKQDWDGEVFSKIGEISVHLRETRNSEGEPLELIDIKSLNGKVIDTFSDEFLSGSPVEISGLNSYYDLMDNLHETARRNASGVDKAIDKLLDDLS